VDVPWSEGLLLEYPTEPDGLYYLSDPQTELVTEGKSIGKTRVSVTLRAFKRGIYLLTPFTVKVLSAGQDLVLDPLILSVLHPDEKNHKYPIDVQWAAVFPDRLYVGQPLYLVLLLKNTREILVPDSIRLPAPETGVLEQESYSPPIESVLVGPLKLYSIPVAVWVFTPSEPGRVVIPGSQVQLGSLRRETPPVNLDVLALPPGLEDSGAIGNFNAQLKTDSDVLETGEYLTVSVMVEGSGNLHYLKMPEPVIIPQNGMKFISISEENRMTPVKMGYTGTRTIHYRYQSLESGAYQISLKPFSFMSPDTGSIQSVTSKTVMVNVGDNSEPLDQQENQVSALMVPLAGTQLPFYSLRFDHKNPYLFLFLLPGVLLIIFFYLERWGIKGQTLRILYSIFMILITVVFISSLGVHFLMVRHPAAVTLEKGNTAFHEKNLDEALFYYQEAESLEPDNPALLYNLGLAYHEKGDMAAAIFYLRKAMVFRTWDARFSGLLDEMEKEQSLVTDSVPVAGLIPEVFLIVSIVCLNLFFIMIYFYLKSGKIRMALTGLFNLILSLALITGFISAVIRNNLSFAVVRNTGTDMKKAPSPTASHWLEIKKGMTVHIIADIGDYILVKTIYGVEGWVRKEDLWY
jgi:hypothetical protein